MFNLFIVVTKRCFKGLARVGGSKNLCTLPLLRCVSLASEALLGVLGVRWTSEGVAQSQKVPVVYCQHYYELLSDLFDVIFVTRYAVHRQLSRNVPNLQTSNLHSGTATEYVRSFLAHTVAASLLQSACEKFKARHVRCRKVY